MPYSIKQIVTSPLFKITAHRVFGNRKTVVISRPGSYLVRQITEGKNKNVRLLLLPPHGHTADKSTLLNPHPEARKAKIFIHGKIDPEKKGFKPCLDEIQFFFSLKRNIPTKNNAPYARIDKQYCGTKLLSWKNWFYVVRESGWGNFHNLINLSDEWLLLVLEKELLDKKRINLKPTFSKLQKSQASNLIKFIKTVQMIGDDIFKKQARINAIIKYPPLELTKAFLQMLNAPETGMHENCSFFALLLQVAKNNRALVKREVQVAMKNKSATFYYLNELNEKLNQ